jgi:hypothetical protein
LCKEQAHLVAVTGGQVVMKPDHVTSFVEDGEEPSTSADLT